MREFSKTVRAGKHRGRPLLPSELMRCTLDDVMIYVDFNDEMQPLTYNHSDEDKMDWNKLVGFKVNLLRPMRNSVMIAWRYNKDKDKIQLGLYWHDSNGTPYLFDTLVRNADNHPNIIDLDPSQDIGVVSFFFTKSPVLNPQLGPYRITVQCPSQDVKKQWGEYEFSPEYMLAKKGWLISHWFGGTSPSQHDLTFDFKIFNYY